MLDALVVVGSVCCLERLSKLRLFDGMTRRKPERLDQLISSSARQISWDGDSDITFTYYHRNWKASYLA